MLKVDTWNFFYISGIEILMLLRPQRCEKDRKSKSEKAFRIFFGKIFKNLIFLKKFDIIFL